MLRLVDRDGDPLRGTVVRVADGDTIQVELSTGRRERVRVLGIDAPELNPLQCYGRQATERARALADGKSVRLVLDSTQDDRDRFDRLLAYVLVDESLDLGRELVAEGSASVFVFDRPFRRISSYRDAESEARRARAGLWRACASP